MARTATLFLAMLTLFLAVPAMAADAVAPTTVSLSPIYSYVNEFAGLVLEGLAAVFAIWVMYLLNKYVAPYIPATLRAGLEAKASAALNTALQNGIPIALHELNAWETVHTDYVVQSSVLAKAANYAVTHVPEAVARFGLTPDALAKKALAYLPPPPPSKP